jgi:hypothetical protein
MVRKHPTNPHYTWYVDGNARGHAHSAAAAAYYAERDTQ